jgi:hypothetical protein
MLSKKNPVFGLPCHISEVYSSGKNINILGQSISFDVLRYFRTLKIGVARTSHVRVAKQQEGYPWKLMKIREIVICGNYRKETIVPILNYTVFRAYLKLIDSKECSGRPSCPPPADPDV